MILNMVGILVTFFGYIVIKKNLIMKIHWLEEYHITPADYAVMGYNLPKISRSELKKQLMNEFQGLKIIYINYCYNVDLLIKYNMKLLELFQQKTIYETMK